jgi:hypothetical protein
MRNTGKEAELIAWAVVMDDNLHRRPKRAPGTLPRCLRIQESALLMYSPQYLFF